MSARHAALRPFMRTPHRRPLTLIAVGSLTLLALASPDADPVTSKVSIGLSGAQADAESTGPAISADGRYIAFVSWATNLVAGDTNNYGDVFVRDLQTGSVVRASVATGSGQAQGESYAPAISADGLFVAFVSDAWNLVGSDTNEVADVFVRDLAQGTTVRASVASTGAQASAASTNPVLSADGRYVAFESQASNLVGADGNGECDVFLRDLTGGTTERVSLTHAGGEASGASQMPAISSDGRFVAFASAAENVITQPLDTNKAWDVFLRDRASGTTVRVSLSASGAQSSGNSIAPSLSPDGRFVAFESQATDLVGGDTNGRADVFLRDLQTATTARVSVGSGGLQANGASVHPSICADGRYVAFASKASNLVAGDTNDSQDVFLHDRVLGATLRASLASDGSQGQGTCLWPALSQDGRFVAFPCDAAGLVSADTNAVTDVFVRGPLF